MAGHYKERGDGSMGTVSGLSFLDIDMYGRQCLKHSSYTGKTFTISASCLSDKLRT